MSKKDEIISEKAFIKKHVYASPLLGAKLTALGSALLFAYAFSELNVRIDAIDGLLQAYFKLADSWYTGIKTLLSIPEARSDILKLFYLFFASLSGVSGCIWSQSYRTAWYLIPVSICCALFSVTSGLLAKLISPLEMFKVAGCFMILMGSVLKLIQASIRKHYAVEKYINQHRDLQYRRKSTIIPKRTHDS